MDVPSKQLVQSEKEGPLHSLHKIEQARSKKYQNQGFLIKTVSNQASKENHKAKGLPRQRCWIGSAKKPEGQTPTHSELWRNAPSGQDKQLLPAGPEHVWHELLHSRLFRVGKFRGQEWWKFGCIWEEKKSRFLRRETRLRKRKKWIMNEKTKINKTEKEKRKLGMEIRRKPKHCPSSAKYPTSGQELMHDPDKRSLFSGQERHWSGLWFKQLLHVGWHSEFVCSVRWGSVWFSSLVV